ncbi:sensor histidine kinase [Streptomyces kroppenstedtii]|uniref:sensor histidine kinase n=1 Tax=Streptomyces kroppenstedtii TaxID=3051181 RepID=UPI0028D720EF|nr:HAMP domain-containing sensor histidine kinase [Streptomyces sp. DSM 40484]
MRPVRWSFGQLTIRTRLALLNATVFVVGCAALLALVWASAREIIGRHGPTVMSVAARSADSAQPESAVTDAPTGPAVTARPSSAARFAIFEQDVLEELLARCLLLFVVIACLSVVASWWVAKRGLSRIGLVTAAARDIGDRNLHARLALEGPADEAKELADTFDAMLDRLERSFAEQRRFTGHASHELRTPLTVQRTALEIPLSQGRIPDDLLPNVRRALNANHRSERLIAALLALAKGESGVLLPAAVDLAEEARTAIAEVLDEARETEVTVDTRLRPAPVWGDPSLLGQLVGNLVTNAVRHNERDGSVHIATGPTGVGGAFVEVTNTGARVDAAELPTLYEPFRRGSGRRKGAGLGLSVVRAVTTTHHGTLTTGANPAGGLTVRVELPVERARGREHGAGEG